MRQCLMSNIKPNLPQDNAKIVVMSTNNKDLVKRVEELGIKVLSSENLSKLLIFEQYHADLQYLYLKNVQALRKI